MRTRWISGIILTTALAACDAGTPSAPAATPADARQAGNIAAQPAPAPQGRFAPRNECLDLPGAKPFFLALENAVKARDADALLRLTDAKVKLDFGGGAGLQTFRERLADKDGRLWEELAQITALGCARGDNGDMVMPWYFAQDMNDVDTYTAMIATGTDVPVFDRPSSGAAKVDSVSWDVVTVGPAIDLKARFHKVTTLGGKEGYVAADQLRSILDYRIIASRVGNDWRIVSFVAGD